MTQLKSPGLYTIDDADYFADPCPQASLTQSIAKLLIERSPMHAAYAHPRLNPNWSPDDDKKFDLGNIAHAMLMGRGRDFHMIEADDWRTKAAKEDRAAALAKGKLPVLRRHMETANEMYHTAVNVLTECGIAWIGADGVHSEATMIWQEGQAAAPVAKGKKTKKIKDGIWLRTKMDRVVFEPKRITVYDYKTTGMSAADADVSRRIYDAGWDVQAAMHARGLVALHPLMAGCTRHVFIVQETDAPYCCNVFELPESVMTGGRQRLQRAITKWAECTKKNHWPAYTNRAHPIFYPPWALQRLGDEGYSMPSEMEAAE